MRYYLVVLFWVYNTSIYFGQIDTSIADGEIVIYDERMHVPFQKNARSIEVITSEMIAKMPVQSLPELLQYYSGVDIRRRGVGGVQADISIRGGSFEQTLVLINGIKMNDPQTGHHMMNLPVALQQIERIEIVRGSASKLYGQNAMNGVVNVITKSTRNPAVHLEADIGSFGTYQLHGDASFSTGSLSHTISIDHVASDGYQYNTDFTINTFSYQNQAKLSTNTDVQFVAGFTDRKFGANAFYASENFKDQYEEVSTSLVSSRFKSTYNKWSWNYGISWRRNRDMYLFLRQDPGFYRNRHISQRIGGDISTSYHFKYGSIGIGTELWRETLVSNNLGNHQRNIIGLFIDYRWDITDKLFVHPGLYVNSFSDQSPQLFPGIDASYQWTQSFLTFASFNKSNRIPTYTDLYYTSPAEKGSPDLSAESMLATELGAKWTNNVASLQLSLYQNEGHNLIDWYKEDPNQDQWVATNFRSIKSRGLELGVNLPVSKWLDSKHNFELSYQGSLISTEPIESTNGVSRYTLDHLSDQHIMKVNASFLDNRLRLFWAHRWVQRNSFEELGLFNYYLMDAAIGYDFKRMCVKFNTTNLTNTAYKETSLVLMPGRAVNVSVSFNL